MQHDAGPDHPRAADVAARGADVELTVIVSAGPASGWHACVIGPGGTRREFASPFELARFVAWPHGPRPRSPRDRLR